MTSKVLRDGGGLVFSLLLSFAAAGLGGWLTNTALSEWYPSLTKPSWNPPDWIFGPVWTLLYAAMAIAAWLVWLQRQRTPVKLPLTLYALQLVLNVIWSALFFALRNPGAAFGEVLLLWLAILATLIACGRVDRWAGILLAPYLAWVSFAAVLNFTIWRLN